MKLKHLYLPLLLFLVSIAAHAQRLNGLRIDTERQNIVVYINGQQMNEPAASCFIANLRQGNYHIEVFRASHSSNRHPDRERIYSCQILYDGRGVESIYVPNNTLPDVPDYTPDAPHYVYGNVMSPRTFKDYCDFLKKESFDNNRLKQLDLLPTSTEFTSKQCFEIAKIFSFDNNRVEALKKLYPHVVDKESFYIAIDALTFSSYRDEISDFIKRYNDRHRL